MRMHSHGRADAAENETDGRPESRAHANYPGNTQTTATTGRDAAPGRCGEPPWDAACHWLERFWEVVIRDDKDRTWRIGALTEPDNPCDGRDAPACVLVHRRLDKHARVEEHFYPAWASQPACTPPGLDYFVIGRPHLYATSEAALYMQPLSACAHGHFEERPRSRTATGLTYGEQRFFREELEIGGRRIRRDYAVLMFRRYRVGGEEVRAVSVAGVSAVATLALTSLLTDPDELDILFKQVRAVLPPECPARFDEAFEICVRFDIEKKDLQNFANERRFEFEVEVVTGGDAVFSRTDPMELVLCAGKGGGGKVVAGARQVKLSARRLVLLCRLIERPAGVPWEELVDEFYLMPKGLSMDGSRGSLATQDEIDRAYGVLRVLVCKTNDAMEKLSPQWRPIEQVEGCYVLRARARVQAEE